ncbi:MAG: histidinol-phosphate aminotransferase family protein [Oscillospiraceae bacterium]|nr:histidinol-phosphate aminotransferase family protein [Oscillospiraceae bacterium]
MKLPDKFAAITPYTPVTGDYAVRLDANESFLPLPDWLLREIHGTWARLPLHRYPDPLATAVRQRAASLYGVDADQVVAGNGSDELIALIMSTFTPRKGRVLLTDPDFSMYRFYADLYELGCRAIGKPDRRPDIDAVLRSAEEEPPDLVIFSNPCNPAGLGAPRQEVLRLLDAVSCPVVVDEAYMDFWDQSVIDCIPQYGNLIVLKTCSKAVGLAGLRLGFAIAQRGIAGALLKIKSPYNVNALTQAAGEVVLSHPVYLRNCAARIKSATLSLQGSLRALAAQTGGWLGVLPTETNFVLLQTPEAGSIFSSLCRRGILIRKLGPTLLRVTAGSISEQAALLQALEEIVVEFQGGFLHEDQNRNGSAPY